MIKAIIFDLDGTLLDSMLFWKAENPVVMKHFAYPMTEETEKELSKISSREVSRRIADAGLASFETAYSKYVDDMTVLYTTKVPTKPGAKEYLDDLRSKGVRMCVASATPKRATVPALKKHGLFEYLEAVYDETDIGTTKGDPEFFKNIALRFGVSVSETALFDDSLYAVNAAKKAGLTVYSIEDVIQERLSSREKIIAVSDAFVKDFHEARTAINL